MNVAAVSHYPEGDLRRLLVVLAAIDVLTDATLMRIADLTGLDEPTITTLIAMAVQQAGVKIEKDGAAYRLVNWGPVIKRSGAKLALAGELANGAK
ncbi:MAG: hypothetical protein ACHP7E_09375 [Burkholderiales bacterium]